MMVHSGYRARVGVPTIALLFLACTGTISDPGISRDGNAAGANDGNGGGVDTDGDGKPDTPANGNTGNNTGGNNGGGDTNTGGASGSDDASLYTYATLGTRCSGGSNQRFVVISRAASSCEDHARAIDDANTNDVLRVPVDGSGAFSGKVSLCEGGQCRDVDVSVTLAGDSASGNLSASLSDKPLQRAINVTACDYDSLVPPTADALAANISIAEIAAYQGVKVSLAQNGQAVTSRNAPLVQGRPALLRVFVQPGSAFTAHPIVARLTLDNGDAQPTVVENQLDVSGASDDATMGSTLNFNLTADQIQANTKFSVSLHEVEVCGAAGASDTSARFPATDTAELTAESPGSPFKIVLVPVRYNADGSGRLPDVSPDRVDFYRQHLFNIFPVADVEITVRDQPMDFDGVVVGSTDSGWSQLLDACLNQRDIDGPDERVYYYCIFNPTDSFAQYCQGGCIVGIGPVTQANDEQRRGSIGLGFGTTPNTGESQETMAHELGHALGRPHAPCGGAAGPDPKFPYSDGSIGSWGYDALNQTLISPDDGHDLMGYCNNNWISDYNFNLLFRRFQSVLTRPRIAGQRIALTSIIIDSDLSLSIGHQLSLDHMPPGELVRVTYLDGNGQELLSAEGSFAAVTHANGGIAYVPQAPAGTASVDIEGFGRLSL